MRIIAALLVALVSASASAETLCPTVSDNTSVIAVTIQRAPPNVSWANYDMKTGNLTVGFQNHSRQMFLAVPRQAVTGQSIAWASVIRYQATLMQQDSGCPLLSQTGQPLLPGGTARPPNLGTLLSQDGHPLLSQAGQPLLAQR